MLLELDLQRYISKNEMPKFQKYMRKYQESKNIIKFFYKFLFRYFRNKNHVEISADIQVGEGLYLGHPYGITINPEVVIGKNCNIHKGVTIGRENRGIREGVPTIGDEVWIGINSTIVGSVSIGNDVLIAPNTYVNQDIPDHSVVFGNPCIIKHNDHATQDYINRKC